MYTYSKSMRRIADMLSPETATILQGKAEEIYAVKGDNELTIVRITKTRDIEWL